MAPARILRFLSRAARHWLQIVTEGTWKPELWPEGRSTNARIPQCPVCLGESEIIEQQPGWGTWQKCKKCTLEFADPLRLPRTPIDLFDDAYQGRESQSGFGDFAHRVRQRDALVHQPELWFWTPAFRTTLEWLHSRLPAGATVFDIGCGLGFFLHALRKEGFHAAGLDVAKTAVDLNTNDGFAVWHGPIESLPEGWVEPAAITAFFMLHHVEEPVQMLQTIRQRWPSSPIAIAQYGPSNRNSSSSMAPRNLTRWNSRALSEVLTRAGYISDVRDISSTGMEHPAFTAGRGALFEGLIKAPAVYRVVKRFADSVLPKLLRPLRRQHYVILALAEPVIDAKAAAPMQSKAPRPGPQLSGQDVARTA
jgi:hypothetical protein